MIIDAKDVFIAKKTYDQSKKDWGGKTMPKNHDSALIIQNNNRSITKAVNECRNYDKPR